MQQRVEFVLNRGVLGKHFAKQMLILTTNKSRPFNSHYMPPFFMKIHITPPYLTNYRAAESHIYKLVSSPSKQIPILAKL